jgi:hypothetical protein
MYVTDEGQEFTFNGTIWGAAASGALADIFSYTGFDPTTEYEFEDETISSDLSFFVDDVASTDWIVTDVLPDAAEGTTYSLRSTDITHGQTTDMRFDVNADLVSAVRVRYRIGSDGSDGIRLRVDDGGGFVTEYTENGTSTSGAWAWQEVDMSGYSGTVTFSVQYQKSVSGNSSYDSIFISQIDLLYGFTGERGSVVEHRGRVWVSKVNDNTDTPSPSSEKWKAIGYTSDFIEEETGTSYTVDADDMTGGVIKEMNNAGTITVTVPPDLDYTGNVTFVQTGAGGVSFAAGSGVTLLSDGGKLASAGQYTGVTLIPKGSNTFLLMGALS